MLPQHVANVRQSAAVLLAAGTNPGIGLTPDLPFFVQGRAPPNYGPATSSYKLG